jgi:putative transposase
MPIQKAYKTEIEVNNRQNTLLLQHLGCSRWAYNWALSKKKDAFDKKEKIPNAIELHRVLNQIKKTEFPWFYESSKSAPQNALRDCDKAFQNFFTRCKKKTKGKKGFPKFKSKKNTKKSFRLDGAISVSSTHIKLPRIGKLKLREQDYLPANYKILSATISTRANRWFVSLLVEVPDIEPQPSAIDVLAVDLGIKTLATCSDGTVFENPKALKSKLRSLKQRSRKLSRKPKQSKNYEKAKHNLANLHYKIANIRKDCLHKITTSIIQKANVIVLEDLKVSNLLKNHHLSQAISDVGMHEFRRQIEYKAKWHGKTVFFAPTFFPSSKLDHQSKSLIPNLKLSDRTIKHDDGTQTDRDLNATYNLRDFYIWWRELPDHLKNTESSSGIVRAYLNDTLTDASGERSSLSLETSSVSLSKKEETQQKI